MQYWLHWLRSAWKGLSQLSNCTMPSGRKLRVRATNVPYVNYYAYDPGVMVHDAETAF